MLPTLRDPTADFSTRAGYRLAGYKSANVRGSATFTKRGTMSKMRRDHILRILQKD